MLPVGEPAAALLGATGSEQNQGVWGALLGGGIQMVVAALFASARRTDGGRFGGQLYAEAGDE